MTSDGLLGLYENERYIVVAVDFLGPEADGDPYTDGRFQYDTGYAVVNKETEVWEHVCTQLPEACFTAMSLNNAMDAAPWNWKDKGENVSELVN